MERRRQRIGGILLLAVICLCLPYTLTWADVLPGVPGVEWTIGPAKVPLEAVGTLDVPEGYRFTGPIGARKFDEWNQALTGPEEIGILIPPLEQFSATDGGWYIILSYDDIGYVKDDEKSSLDAAAIFESIRKDTDEGNAELLKRGWPTMQVIGWQQQPAYDEITHHLTWAILGSDQNGTQVVNYSSRILGHSGIIKVKLVLAPKQLASTIPTCRMIEGKINFVSGQTYQEFRTGDKVAKYGLTALITGGATVAAFKFWKPLMAGGAAVIAFLAAIGRKIKGAITGKPTAAAPAVADPSPAARIVTCPRCKQKNRIAAGSQSAKCGHCKMTLS